jgi:outer membrane murein-binding lipoprotein Lpp
MNIRAEYFIGKQKNNEWSGVYGYRPEEESDLETAELFSVIKITTEAENVGLERIAKLLLDEFQQSYYGSKVSSDRIIRLEEALSKMKSRLDLILSREDEVVQKGLDLEMAIAVVNDDILYAALVGESKILIQRDNKLVDISSGLTDGDMQGFVRSGSLKLTPSDRVCLGTSVINAKAKLEIIQTALQLDINKLSAMEDLSGAAFLIFADEIQPWAEEELQDASEGLEDVPSPVESVPLHNQEGSVKADEPVMPLEGSDEIETTDLNGESDNLEQGEYQESDSRFIEEGAGSEGISSRLKSLREKFNRFKSRDGDGESMPNISDYPESDSEIDSENQRQISLRVIQERLPVYGKKAMEGGRKIGSVINNRVISKIRNNDKTYAAIINRVLDVIKEFVTKAWRVFKKEIIGNPGDRRDSYMNATRRKRNRILLTGVVIVGVLVIYFSLRDAQLKRVEAERVQAAQSKVSQLQDEMELVSSQVESAKTEGEEKKELLITKIDSIISDAQRQSSTGLFSQELNQIKIDGENAKEEILLISSLNQQNLIVVADIGKLYPDATLSDLVFSKGSLFASDSSRDMVYKINPVQNSDPVEFVKSGLSAPQILVSNVAGDIIVYDETSTSAIGKINQSTGELVRYPQLAPAVIGSVEEVGVYSANDALYELHQNHQQIFRRDKDSQNNYGGGGAVYSTINPPNWKTDPEFANALDIDIPYEVYVLIEDVGLKRYLSGGDNSINEETYMNLISSDRESLKSSTSFDVSGKYLAMSDVTNKRVMLFEIIDNEQKNLMFVKQYVYKGDETIFSNIKEIAVDDSTGTIFVLDGTRIISLAI